MPLFFLSRRTTRRRLSSIMTFLGPFAAPAFAQVALPPLKTSITVTETLSASVAAHMTVLDASTLDRIAGVNADDRLRTIPGFSLFRRSSSLVAHPSTQGVSLRGLGSTAASRTSVRWDGVPLNEPFGGWIQWSRVAPEALDRIEVTRGASTSLFGDHSMGGSISLFSKAAERNRLESQVEAGNRATRTVSAAAARRWNRWAASAHWRGVTTGGYYIVRPSDRGLADRPARSRFTAGDLRLDAGQGAERLFLKLDVLAEERSNGTVLRRNSTSLGSLSAHYFRNAATSSLSLIAWHVREQFWDHTSSLSPDRNTETPATRQRVPAESAGATALWRKQQSHWSAIAGADLLRVEGYSYQTNPATGVTQVTGGVLPQHGYFTQLEAGSAWLRLFAGARFQSAGSGRRLFSPSAGLTAARGPVRLRASAYRAFRIPTLDEMYRQFRVGNTVTFPNPDLRPETMSGGEVGLDWSSERSRLSLTAYHNSLGRLITNVTISTTPSLIQRQKRNAGQATARGVEAELRHRWRSLLGELSYLFVDSRFSSGPRLPQVARHQGSAMLTHSGPRTLFTAGVRAYSSQFEDDLNTYRMPGYAVLHFSVQRELGRALVAVFTMENTLNREFIVGFTPTAATGAPRLWRVGWRWRS
ncbi:MAG: TonB-dependent receptor [Bryobacteraceae bacterium]